jgi:L-malate glycosyltransferase
MLGPVMVMQNLIICLSRFDGLLINLFYLDKKVDQNIRFAVPANRLIPGDFRFENYDIIHTNGIRPDLFAFLNRKKIKYHISTIHNFVFEDLAFTYNRLISWIFGNVWLILWKRADKLVCVSEKLNFYCVKWFTESKLITIHNGIPEPDSDLKPDRDIIEAIDKFRSQGLKILGCTGILTKRKGIGQVLQLLAEEKEFALVIIGEGRELNNLKELSKKLQITDRCMFCGFRTNAVIYFRLFDYFIMASRSEGFGLSLIEAVQQKVPVICSDLDVFKELFTGDEVTFFKTGDLASMTTALECGNGNGKIKSERAYRRYFRNYTASLMAKNYSDLYRTAS